jgi:hypothetical protein
MLRNLSSIKRNKMYRVSRKHGWYNSKLIQSFKDAMIEFNRVTKEYGNGTELYRVTNNGIKIIKSN